MVVTNNIQQKAVVKNDVRLDLQVAGIVRAKLPSGKICLEHVFDRLQALALTPWHAEVSEDDSESANGSEDKAEFKTELCHKVWDNEPDDKVSYHPPGRNSSL
jgi:hypothetical protein